MDLPDKEKNLSKIVRGYVDKKTGYDKWPNEGQVSYWGIIDKEGVPFYINTNRACHAGLRYWYTLYPEDGGRTFAMFNMINLHQDDALSVDQPLVQRFLKWYYEESPYKVLLLNTLEDALENLVILINPHWNVNFIASACAAPRLLWEHRERAELWLKLVEGGVNPNVAFALAHAFREYEPDKFSRSNASWHISIDGHDVCMEMFEVFIYGPRTAYYNENTMAGLNGYSYISQSMVESVHEYEIPWETLLYEGEDVPQAGAAKIRETEIFGFTHYVNIFLSGKKKVENDPVVKIDDFVKLSEKIIQHLKEKNDEA